MHTIHGGMKPQQFLGAQNVCNEAAKSLLFDDFFIVPQDAMTADAEKAFLMILIVDHVNKQG